MKTAKDVRRGDSLVTDDGKLIIEVVHVLDEGDTVAIYGHYSNWIMGEEGYRTRRWPIDKEFYAV
jgi:hypothetical protein